MTDGVFRRSSAELQGVKVIASVKRLKCNDTGNSFRSSDLRVMSPQSETARFLCAMPVESVFVKTRAASVKRLKCNDTGNSFRSSDLRVMSPARCLCATPVERCLCEDEGRFCKATEV